MVVVVMMSCYHHYYDTYDSDDLQLLLSSSIHHHHSSSLSLQASPDIVAIFTISHIINATLSVTVHLPVLQEDRLSS
jgi:hypothetical protein